MPPIGGGDYLLAYLFEIGPVMSGGMGPSPITHAELRAWQANVGIGLAPWEARFLRRLSQDYAGELHRAEKRDAAAPWKATDAEPAVSDTQAAIRALARL